LSLALSAEGVAEGEMIVFRLPLYQDMYVSPGDTVSLSFSNIKGRLMAVVQGKEFDADTQTVIATYKLAVGSAGAFYDGQICSVGIVHLLGSYDMILPRECVIDEGSRCIVYVVPIIPLGRHIQKSSRCRTDDGIEFTDLSEINTLDLSKLPTDADSTDLWFWRRFSYEKQTPFCCDWQHTRKVYRRGRRGNNKLKTPPSKTYRDILSVAEICNTISGLFDYRRGDIWASESVSQSHRPACGHTSDRHVALSAD